MSDEKKPANEELSDELLEQADGGFGYNYPQPGVEPPPPAPGPNFF